MVFEVENNSKHYMSCLVKTDVGNDCIFLSPGDKKQMQFRKEEQIKMDRYPGEVLYDLLNPIKCLEYAVYDITDTTKYVWVSNQPSKQDSLFYANQKTIIKGDEYDRVYVTSMTIIDTLLSITTKDYTMLEKFSEYYQQ
ncbi:hypothetical protein AGMMS49982_12790 [Bacteroidia bacterium]|nr:hypothetical protein AGMMS49982_12790 [Bacteroidia bacterium]